MVNECFMGGNIVDLCGIVMEWFEVCLDWFEDIYCSVIVVVYENLVGIN